MSGVLVTRLAPTGSVSGNSSSPTSTWPRRSRCLGGWRASGAPSAATEAGLAMTALCTFYLLYSTMADAAERTPVALHPAGVIFTLAVLVAARTVALLAMAGLSK